MWRGVSVLTVLVCLLVPAAGRAADCLSISDHDSVALARAGTKGKPARVPRGWVGMVASYDVIGHPSYIGPEFRRMAKAGVQTARTVIDWSTVEPSQGSFTWGPTDSIVAAAARNRVGLLPTVLRAPGWAAGPLAPGTSTLQPRDPQLYAAFLTALVKRYGPNGGFWRAHPKLRRKPVRSWQIWNEPNGAYFWNPSPPWQDSYTALLKASHKAIKAADPGAKVVVAGLSNTFWVHLRALYRAGARRYFDAVAVHPYTHAPNKDLLTIGHFVQEVRCARNVMRANGDATKPLLVTEFGWPSAASRHLTSPANFLSTTDAGQGRLLMLAYKALAHYRARLHIGGADYFTWLSKDGTSPNPFDYSGLRTLQSGAPRDKPALKAFKQIAKKLERRR